MLKAAVAASDACMDTIANVLLDQIDQIGCMISQLAKLEYNPPPVDRLVVDNASEEAIVVDFLQSPVIPAPSPIASAPPANGTVVS